MESTVRLPAVAAAILWLACSDPVVTDARTSAAIPCADRASLAFEENRGQAPTGAGFLVRAPGLLAVIGGSSVDFHVSAASSPGVSFGLVLSGADPKATARGESPLAGRISYCRGRDPDGWIRNVPTFTRVRCPGVYPGIDVVWHGRNGRLEYDLEVAPGGDPGRIELWFPGAESAGITDRGRLRIAAGGSEIVHEEPVAWQEGKEGRRSVRARFVERTGGAFGFEVEGHDPSETLVIDPVLSWSTHLGGALRDYAQDVAVDAAGNAYVTGYTQSADFPAMSGSLGGSQDAFVAKLSPDGSALLWCVYLGGVGSDNGLGLALDGAGNICVAGMTASSDFPVTPAGGACQTTFGGGNDAFVVRLDTDGSITYATYLGGPGSDSAFDVAAGPGGFVAITGGAQAGFPTTAGAFDTAVGGTQDAYVARLSLSGNGASDLVYATYLGGTYADLGRGIAVDGSGSIYLTGETTSVRGAAVFPTTPNAYKPTQKIPANTALPSAFVTKLNPAGAGAADLVYSTYLNNPGGLERGNAVDVDALGRIYAAGYTSLTSHPTTAGAYDRTHNGSADVWVTVLDPSVSGATGLVYSTFLGGSAEDYGQGIAVDATFQVTVAGTTNAGATPFPTTFDALPGTPVGFDAFVTRLSIAGGGSADLIYSTRLGGEGWDDAQDLALRGSGEITVCGGTGSATFPATGGAFDPSPNGGDDGFVLRIDLGGGMPSPPTNLAATPVSDSRIDLGWQDTASNETGFEIERSTDGSGWATLVTLGAGTTSHSDTGLSASSTWHYRVRAVNGSGVSAWSNFAVATTLPAGIVDTLASGEVPVSGTVAGAYTATHASGDPVEAIQEIESGGNPSQRYSYLEHRWVFSGVPSGVLTLHAVAFQSASTDGDTFQFSWSSDGANFTNLAPVLSNTTPQSLSWPLSPSHPGGTITIRVVDTDRVPGHRAKDTLTVDHLFVRKS